ncbi:LPS assembly lipoprotein LptE [Pontiella sp.]|uniref:LPS assembly lipoprotein LptE n=1 Tax=Pontiella sp. TaxID=2837462 RepID=UPI0035651F4F
MKRRFYLLNCLGALLFSGCMGYQLDGATRSGVNTVALGPVINNTTESAIEIEVTHAMRSRLQFDGRVRLANEPENADAVIQITLTKFEMRPIAYKSEFRTTPDLYRLKITGEAELINPRTGNVIARSGTYGESTFEFNSDLTSSKRTALPPAAEEIAGFMLDDLIEAWR